MIVKDDSLNGKGEDGKWITVNGSHIFVEDGQSVEDALNDKFKKGEKSEDDRLNKILTERNKNEDADFAKDTGYFGYGSLDALEKAHNNGYKENQDKPIPNAWQKVNTVKQAKKIDPDIVEKKLAYNILSRYGKYEYSDDELADKADWLKEVSEPYDINKVKSYIKGNRELGSKIFMSWHELSDAFK